jgi:hypothetical protein
MHHVTGHLPSTMHHVTGHLPSTMHQQVTYTVLFRLLANSRSCHVTKLTLTNQLA